MRSILVVDHDSNVLSSIKKQFQGTEYNIMTESDGVSALEILKSTEINIIICSLNLPTISGNELLSKVMEEYPSVVRIIMSEASELASVFRAIHQTVAKYYILKPWKEYALFEYISQIMTTEDRLHTKDLLNMINHLEKLPTIEASYQKILNMIEKDSDIGSITDVIEKDFAISSKLLQLANSAFYGLRTGSIKHATVFLGLSNLKSLIYSTTILNSFDGVSEQNSQRLTALWNHAILTNKLLHYIYEEFLGKKLSEDACSAGLLHNIGTLVLIYNRVEDYNDVMNKVSPKLLNMLEVEQSAFRVTHQEAGGYLASFWKLPLPIVESALYHHRPFESGITNSELVYAVHLAQNYSWQLTKQPAVAEFYPEVFDLLQIDSETFETAVNWNSWL